jgi:hypothetical protein
MEEWLRTVPTDTAYERAAMTRADRQRLKQHQENTLRLAIALLHELQRIQHLDPEAAKSFITQIVADYRRVTREKKPCLRSIPTGREERSGGERGKLYRVMTGCARRNWRVLKTR